MTDEYTKRPKDDDEPESDENFFENMETSNGMTMARMREIEDAEASGRSLELSAEERVQYEESKEELSKVWDSLKVTMSQTFEPINKQLKGIIADSYRPAQLEPIRARTPLSPESHYYEPLIADIGEPAEERTQREQTNATNIAATAMAIQNLLGTIQADSTKGTKRWRWMLGVAVLTLLAAMVAAVPPVIDWLKVVFP